MAGLWNGPYSNLESCLMRMEMDRKESLHSRLIEIRRWIDVQDTLGFWGGGARCYWPQRAGANHKDR